MRETARSRSAFEAYCNLGPDRSLVKLREALRQKWTDSRPPALKTLKNWSSLLNWQERVREWESKEAERLRKEAEKEAERKRKQRERELERMNERHALIGMTQQEKAMEQINALIKARKFGSQATVQLLKLAMDAERLARGQATEQSRVEVAGVEGQPLVIKTVWDRALLNLASDLEETEIEGQHDQQPERGNDELRGDDRDMQ